MHEPSKESPFLFGLHWNNLKKKLSHRWFVWNYSGGCLLKKGIFQVFVPHSGEQFSRNPTKGSFLQSSDSFYHRHRHLRRCIPNRQLLSALDIRELRCLPTLVPSFGPKALCSFIQMLPLYQWMVQIFHYLYLEKHIIWTRIRNIPPTFHTLSE